MCRHRTHRSSRPVWQRAPSKAERTALRGHEDRDLTASVVALVAAAGRAEAACTVSTTSANFGTYDVFNPSANASTATITYRCGGDKDILITLSKGSSSTFTPRTLRNGTEVLRIQLAPATPRFQRSGEMAPRGPPPTRSESSKQSKCRVDGVWKNSRAAGRGRRQLCRRIDSHDQFLIERR